MHKSRFHALLPVALLVVASCVQEQPTQPDRVVGGGLGSIAKVVTAEEARPILARDPLAPMSARPFSPAPLASRAPSSPSGGTGGTGGTDGGSTGSNAVVVYEGTQKAALMVGGNAGTPTDGTGGAAVLGVNPGGTGITYVPGSPALLAFCDGAANQVRTMNLTTKEVSLLAGSPDRLPEGTQAGVSYFQNPSGIAYDLKRKVLYVGDSRGRIRRVGLAGNSVGLEVGAAETIAGYGGGSEPFRDGKGKWSFDEDVDPVESRATFRRPAGLVCLGDVLYVADAGFHTIRAVDLSSADFTVTTLAGGKGTSGKPASGTEAVDPADARFDEPVGIAVGFDQSSLLTQKPSALYVADFNNHCVRKIDLTTGGKVTVHGGRKLAAGSRDGAADVAEFSRPLAVFADTSGNVFVGEQGNSRLRRIGADGTVATISGAPTAGAAEGPPSTAMYGSIVGLTAEFNLTTYAVSALYGYDAGLPEENKGARIVRVAP